MSHFDIKSAVRPPADELLVTLAQYACQAVIDSPLATDTARACLMDSLACAFQALRFPACVQRLGPVVPGATLPGGARVPGTAFELDPVQAAFNIAVVTGCLPTKGLALLFISYGGSSIQLT